MFLGKKFGRNKPPKDTASVEFKRWMAKKLDGRALKYILERGDDSTDSVIGKGGFISLYEGTISVICDGQTLFKANVDTMSAWEFMSLEGVTITADDLITGKERTVMCYYTYYRD